jgi:phosphate transport system substrate-binding protein
MWQQEKKDTSIIRLILWVALATTPMAAGLLVSEPILAQSKTESPSLTLPQTVQNGTTIRIDGSSGLSAINQSLKENFEKQFSGSKVEIAANGTDTALKDLLDGKIDIVAMGRGLTPAEKAQGLEQVRLHREKIAIVVSADNPFKGSLTSKQFARIFRGQITNWSQLGGPPGKIRLIDHPNTSETRNTFRTYPAFKTAEFTTGSNATQLTEDNTAEIIKQLGKDGISYVLANQVSKLQNVRILQLHQASPDDAKYPFSQPLVYVYKKNPSLSIVDFLGFTLAPAGQQAIEQARTAEATAIATNGLQPIVSPSPIAQTTPAATASPTTSAFGEQPFVAPATAQKSPIVNKEVPFWVLLPLFFVSIIAALAWWTLGKKPSSTEKTDNLPESNPYPPGTEDGETAVLNASTSASINGAILEEQPVPHFQEQETPDRTSFNIYAQTQSELAENGTHSTSNLVQEATNGTSNLYEGATSTVANGSGAAALTGGAALATGIGAATWSTFNNKGTGTNTIDETVELNNYTETNTPDSDEVAWDIEAPAAVVNTPYPHLGNLPEEISSDGELPSSEVTAPLPELPDVSEVTSDLEYWDTEIAEDEIDEELQAELNWLQSITSTEDIASFDELPLPDSGEVEPSSLSTSSLLNLPELPDVDVFNVVADAAEPPIEVVDETQTEPTVGEGAAENDSIDFADVAALAAGVGIGAWAINLGLDTKGETDPTVDNVPTAETPIALVDADAESSIVLTPHTHTSAHVSWEISETKKAELWQQGGSQLVVRLYDVTGIDLSYQTPQLVQQDECAETAHDRFVEIPISDRDYIAEIGYIAYGKYWLFIARSAILRVFSPVNPDPIVDDVANTAETTIGLVNADEESSILLTPDTSTSAHVSWEISETKKAALRQQGGSQLIVRLYDVTGIDLSYQIPELVKQYESEETVNDGMVDVPVSDRDYIAEIGYLADGERWLFIARSAVVHVFSPVHPDPIVDNVAIADETNIHLVDIEEESSLVLTPRTSQWADVSWEISETKKAELQQQGGSKLVVRLYDATGIDLSYQHPQFVQQYECDETANDRFVEIPISDRDYIAEIGYVADGDCWLFIARSAIAHVFSPVHPDSTVENGLPSETAINLVDVEEKSSEEESKILLTPRTPKWAYVSWHISQTQNKALQQQGGSQLVVRLYDVTGVDLSYQSPQLVQQYECEEVARDRFVAIPVSDRDYMVEIGYIADSDAYGGKLRWLLIARSPNVRVFSRSHEDFWFVADAELIIHGATQPNTSVNIGGHAIKIKPDGTFHLRLPFSDGLMDYLITVAADGASTKTIHKKFSQETSES